MTNDAHVRPVGDEGEELLYDPDVPTPTHAERARTLVSSIGTGTLCTIAKEPKGFPYGSFVTLAPDDGNAVLLISELAEHTKNLRADARCSLLVAEGGEEDPLANGRVTLLGNCKNLAEGEENERARRSYLGSHPNAAYYVDYKDFSFWKLQVESVRYIGGYGRMSWVSRDDWFAAEPDPIAPHARSIMDHMNNDHAPRMVDYCKAFTKSRDTTAASMTAVDRYGFEMSALTSRGPRPIRLKFSHLIATPEDARREMAALAKQARGLLAKS